VRFVDLRGLRGHAADKQTVFHVQSEKAAVQGCTVIEMFRVMTSVVWFSEPHTVR